MTTIDTWAPRLTATFDHRTGDTSVGGPASRYRRVVRCDGRSSIGSIGTGTSGALSRSSRATVARPNYAARRLGALLVTMSAIVIGSWLVGQVAAGLAGQPASAAAVETFEADASSTGVDASVGEVHVARSGDTLWSIADEHRGSIERNRYVDALVDLNGGTAIVSGQAVHLP